MKRRNTLRIFIVGTGLLPVMLLVMAVMGTHIAVHDLRNLNLCGSLRFRSLWLYGATHEVPAEDWHPMWAQMEGIRRRLRVSYPADVARTDTTWHAVSGQLARTGRVDWKSANALRAACDVLTLSIERQARGGAQRAGVWLTLGLVGITVLLTKSLRMARRTEQAEAEHQQLSAILEATPDFVGLVDPKGRALYHNRALRELAGLAPGALLRGLHVTDYHPPLTALALRDEIFPIVRERGFWTGESFLLDKNGQSVPVSQTILVHRDADGDVVRYSTIARDMTAARQAEDALRRNEDRMRRLHDLTTTRSLSFAEKVDGLLRLGCAFFGLDIGVVARIEENCYTVTHAVSPENAILVGWACETASTYCARVMETEQVQSIAHVGGCASWRDLPAYSVFGMEAYLGVPLWVGERLYGTLCFSDNYPRTQDFTPSDHEILRLMAQWLGGELARAQTEDALRQTEEKFRSIFENAMEGIVQTTPDGRFLIANPAMARILGYESPEQLMREMTDIGGHLYADTAERARYMELMRQEGRAVAFEARLRRRDGSLMWACMNARAVQDATGDVAYFEGTVEDVTERHEAAERLRDYSIVLEFQKAELEKANAELELLATTDGLTGLKNHRTFQQQLAEACESAQRYGTSLSVLMLDVDHFKQYNDAFGHPEGDAVLRQVAAILCRTARATDMAARYGGEEFAVILPHTDAEGASIFGERVRAAMERAEWAHRAVTVSVGVSTLCPDKSTPADLVTGADAAMYLSKLGGRNRVTAGAGTQGRTPAAA